VEHASRIGLELYPFEVVARPFSTVRQAANGCKEGMDSCRGGVVEGTYKGTKKSCNLYEPAAMPWINYLDALFHTVSEGSDRLFQRMKW